MRFSVSEKFGNELDQDKRREHRCNNPIDFEDMLRCSYDAEDGDSGGIIYTYINSDYAVVGIHYGELGWLSTIYWHSNAIATKAHNFYTIHGITPY